MGDFTYFSIAPRKPKPVPREARVRLHNDTEATYKSDVGYSMTTHAKNLQHLRAIGVPLRFYENNPATKRNLTFAITCQGGCTGLVAAPTSANTTAGVAGSTAQVETATAPGPVTLAGYVKVTVTSAQFLAGQNPRVLNVLVAASATADAVATAIRAALTADPVVSAKFNVTGATSAIILTSKTQLANDATLNIAIANGDAPATAVATASCSYQVWDEDGNLMAPTDTTTNKHIFPLGEGHYTYRVFRTGWEDLVGRVAILASAVTETKLMTAYR